MCQVAQTKPATVYVKAEFNVNNIQYSNEIWDKGRNKASQKKKRKINIYVWFLHPFSFNIIHQGYELYDLRRSSFFFFCSFFILLFCSLHIFFFFYTLNLFSYSLLPKQEKLNRFFPLLYVLESTHCKQKLHFFHIFV